MKTLKLLLKNMRTSVPRKIIAMLLVSISVCTMNITLSGYLYQERLNNTVKDWGLYDDYMFATPHIQMVSREEREKEKNFVKDKLTELRQEGAVVGFSEVSTVNAPYSNDFKNDRANMVFYPEEFAADINLPIRYGSQMDEYFGSEYTRPIIIGDDFKDILKIGQIIRADEIYGFNLCVVGVLEKDSLVLVSNASGNGLTLNQCFATANDKVIIGAIDDTSHSTFVIKTTSEDREHARQRVQNEIGDAYYTFSFKDLSDKAYEDNRLVTEKKMIVFVISFIVCIVGVGSSNLINTLNQKKRYAIYFFCGMTIKKGIALTVAENIIQMIIPAAIGYLAFLKYCEWQMYLYLRIEATNILVSVLLLLGIFAFTVLKPLIDIRRSSPVEIIGET